MSAAPPLNLPSGVTTRPVRAWHGDRTIDTQDVLAREVPVALVFNGVSHAVMMCTPADEEDFALGFALTEGLLADPGELYGVDWHETAQGVELHLDVAAACEWRLKERRRTLAGRTGCGLCGTDRLDQVRRDLPPVAPIGIALSALASAQKGLEQWQQLQQLSGATHAAAWLDLQGQVQLVREDVGRHNALDKLIGALVRRRIPPNAGFIVVTSRASFEMVQKAAAFGAGLLAAISAPTDLAVQCAHSANLCLVGFLRPGRLSAYTYPERLRSTD